MYLEGGEHRDSEDTKGSRQARKVVPYRVMAVIVTEMGVIDRRG